MFFVIAQIIGFIGLIIVIISFQINNRNSLLKLQIISSFLFALQYLFLSAFTGCFMNLTCTIRNYVFFKFKDKKIPFSILLIFIIVMIALFLVSYSGPLSFLPTIAVVLFTCAVWSGNLKIIRFTEVVSCSLFIIYNIKVLAIVGLITSLIEVINALIAIYRFDIKKWVERHNDTAIQMKTLEDNYNKVKIIITNSFTLVFLYYYKFCIQNL